MSAFKLDQSVHLEGTASRQPELQAMEAMFVYPFLRTSLLQYAAEKQNKYVANHSQLRFSLPTQHCTFVCKQTSPLCRAVLFLHLRLHATVYH